MKRIRRIARRIVGIPMLALAFVFTGVALLSRRLRTVPVLVFVCVLAWPLFALAAGTPPSPDNDANAWWSALYTAFTSGEYKVAGGLIALGIVFVARKFGPVWIKGKTAGYVLNVVVSIVSTIGAAYAVGAQVTIGTVLAALGTAASATGLWELFKDTGVTSSVTPGEPTEKKHKKHDKHATPPAPPERPTPPTV